jgi:hypothetical protein
MLLIRLSRMTNSGAVKVYRKPRTHQHCPDRHRGFSFVGQPGLGSFGRAKKIHALDENPEHERSEEGKVKTKHAIHRQNRRRSMSLDETEFTAHVHGKRFAQYSNRAAQLGLGANVARQTDTRRSKENDSNDSEENADAGASSKMNSQRRADPLQKKEVIDQLRHVLNNHKEGDTDKLHPNRPRRMSRMMTVVSSLSKQSAGVVAWRARLGTALSSELEFLRDKREEQEIQKMAQRDVNLLLGVREQEQERDRHRRNEVNILENSIQERERHRTIDAKKPHKHPSRDKQTNYSLRKEQEALWFRTASTD